MIDKKTLSLFVNRVVPKYLVDENNTLVTFIEKYFEYLGRDLGEFDLVANGLDYIDIDKTIDEFIPQFKAKYIPDFYERHEGDARLLIKNIRKFLAARGSAESYEFLFRTLFDSYIDFYYPKVDILRCSDGKWVIPYYLLLATSDADTTYFVDKKVTGSVSGSEAYIDKFVLTPDPIDSNLNRMSASLANRSGEFVDTDVVTVQIDTDFVEMSVIIPDWLEFTNNFDGTGTLTKISEPELGEHDIQITTENKAIEGDKTTQAFRISIVEPTFPKVSSLVETRAEVGIVYTYDITTTGTGIITITDTFKPTWMEFTDHGNGTATLTGTPTLAGTNNVILTVTDDNGASVQNYTINIQEQNDVPEYSSKPITVFYAADEITYDIVTKLAKSFTIVPSGVVEGTGHWEDTGGFLSWDKHIYDAYYYQEFSYVIQSEISAAYYEDIITQNVHPAGMKMFGEVKILETPVEQLHDGQVGYQMTDLITALDFTINWFEKKLNLSYVYNGHITAASDVVSITTTAASHHGTDEEVPHDLTGKEIVVAKSTADDGKYTILSNTANEITVNHIFTNHEVVAVDVLDSQISIGLGVINLSPDDATHIIYAVNELRDRKILIKNATNSVDNGLFWIISNTINTITISHSFAVTEYVTVEVKAPLEVLLHEDYKDDVINFLDFAQDTMTNKVNWETFESLVFDDSIHSQYQIDDLGDLTVDDFDDGTNNAEKWVKVYRNGSLLPNDKTYYTVDKNIISLIDASGIGNDIPDNGDYMKFIYTPDGKKDLLDMDPTKHMYQMGGTSTKTSPLINLNLAPYESFNGDNLIGTIVTVSGSSYDSVNRSMRIYSHTDYTISLEVFNSGAWETFYFPDAEVLRFDIKKDIATRKQLFWYKVSSNQMEYTIDPFIHMFDREHGSIILKTLTDDTSQTDVVYTGWCPTSLYNTIGTVQIADIPSEDAAVWKIRKVTYTLGEVTGTYWAEVLATDRKREMRHVWTDRLSLTYVSEIPSYPAA